ncbi:MAG: hypothetical protein QG635_2336 [Bacteroidota bacterium]|nr:hypothetical protein [Bacteroidota bacterium]
MKNAGKHSKSISKTSAAKPQVKRKKKSLFERLFADGSPYPYIILAIITFIVYLPSLQNGFIRHYDDYQYLFDNPFITDISPAGIAGLFSNYVFGNYNPITILTFTIEYHFYHFAPFGYHFINLTFHITVTLLLYRWLKDLSGAPQIAFIAGLLFGIHPVHVESVAWVAGRKDVLYAAFFLLSLIFYNKYGLSKKPLNYFLSFLFFALSCLSKAMAVVLPVILFVIDWYGGRKFDLKLILEKIPYFVLSLILGLVAIDAQKTVGAVGSHSYISLFDQFLLATYGLYFYIEKLFIPLGLSANYPYPDKTEGMLPLIIYISPAIIIGLGAAAVMFRKKSKVWLLSGGIFLLGILPVLQILPIGNAYTADRFVYIASIGFFLAIAYVTVKLFQKYKSSSVIKSIIVIVFIASSIAYSAAAWNRSKVWMDTYTLFADVIQKYPKCDFAYFNIGNYFMKRGEHTKAIGLFKQAIALKPDYWDAYTNLGNSYNETGKYDSALVVLHKALEINKNSSDVYNNIGVAYYHLGVFDKAKENYEKALNISPVYEEAYNNLGVINGMNGDYDEAIRLFRKAMELKPDFIDPYKNAGYAYVNKKDMNLAAEFYRKAAELGDVYSRQWLLKKAKY